MMLDMTPKQVCIVIDLPRFNVKCTPPRVFYGNVKQVYCQTLKIVFDVNDIIGKLCFQSFRTFTSPIDYEMILTNLVFLGILLPTLPRRPTIEDATGLTEDVE